MAATWNPELLHQEGHVIGIEGRAKFNDYASKHNGDSKWWTGLTFWTPNINIFRDPRWGRGQETYGEDPFLTGTHRRAVHQRNAGRRPELHAGDGLRQTLRGPQRPGSGAPSFRCRRRRNAICMRRICRSSRWRCARGTSAASWALTTRSTACRTAPIPSCSPICCASNGDLTVTSFRIAAPSAIFGAEHHYVNTPEEAAADAVKAGCDLCCGGDYNALVRAVQQGLVTEKEIDQALYYTLWTRFKLGLFDPPDKIARIPKSALTRTTRRNTARWRSKLPKNPSCC